MTKRIIKDHLLVSGSGTRQDVLALERRCLAAGFVLGRSGQFGIGVLSYFMLADKVVITTRRSQDAADSEPTGWRFETDGIGSFGELKRDDAVVRGTSVRLRLRPFLISGGVAEWFTQMRDYVIDLCISNRHTGHKKEGRSEPVMNERMRSGRLVTFLVIRQRVAMRSSRVSGWPLASFALKWAQTNSSGLSSGA